MKIKVKKKPWVLLVACNKDETNSIISKKQSKFQILVGREREESLAANKKIQMPKVDDAGDPFVHRKHKNCPQS